MAKFRELSEEESKVQITDFAFDCLWVVVKLEKKRKSLSSSLLQSLDWKMGGVLSRLILSQDGKDRTTFIPSMQRIATPLIAIDFQPAFSAEKFRGNVRGLKPQSICCVVEGREERKMIRTLLESMEFSEPMQELCFASE